MFARKRSTLRLVEKDDFYSNKTEHAIPVTKQTDRIPAQDKTAQFVSMINMLVKNNFAVVTFVFRGDSFRVVRLSKWSNKEIEVYFLDYGGKPWVTRVSSYNAFTIFRGV